MEVKSTDFLQHSVQIMAYHENGAHSLGIFKFDEFDNIPYNPSDTPTEIILEGTKYYYYDSWIRLPHEPDIWIRGIIPTEESMWSILRSLLTLRITALVSLKRTCRIYGSDFIVPINQEAQKGFDWAYPL
mgnify:CR=1 FL=1